MHFIFRGARVPTASLIEVSLALSEAALSDCEPKQLTQLYNESGRSPDNVDALMHSESSPRRHGPYPPFYTFNSQSHPKRPNP